MPEAARLGDPVAHTSALAGFLVGAVIGIALIAAVAFATFTCGFGVALLAGLLAGVGASAILGLGEAIGKMFSSKSGGITSGSPNVFINKRKAAFATASTVKCKKHSPVPMVAEGSSNVFYNSLPAARKGDAITCGAKIDDGSGNTFVGGGTVRYLPVDDEVPEWFRTTVDWAFALAGLAGGLAGLVRVAGGLSRATLPCAAKFIGGFVIGEAVGRYVAAPVVSRVFGGQAGHPVEVTTGRKILLAQNETDFVVPSPVPIACARFYGSDLTHEGSLGRGWVLPWELRLQRRDRRLWYTDAQGRESGFPDLKPGEQSFHDSEQRYLSRTAEGRYVVQDLNETYFDFGTLGEEDGATAHLLRIEDQAGQWQTYERGEHGRVQFIRTSGGQELRLHYVHLKGRLTSIVGAEGTRGGTFVTYDYDTEGQLVGVRDANGNTTRQFAYDNGLMVRHTNALGFECRYEWAEIEGQQRVVASSTSEGERYTFDYDPLVRQSAMHDGLGRTAVWTYDEQFQVVECRDLDGGHYRVEYNPSGQPIKLHLPGEREVGLKYDEAGRIVSETDPLGRTTATRYAGNGLRVSEVNLPDGSRWRAEYDLQGRLLSTIDPLGRIERYEYPEGLMPWPAAHIDARGGRKTMGWSQRGQLVCYTDCSGKSTHYEYDNDGHLRAMVDALGQRTEFTRRRTGELTGVELPDGSEELLEYDAAGLPTLHRNAFGHTRRWERNSRGQVLKTTDPADRSLHYRYDELGRLAELRSDNGATYRFAYDHADRLKTEVRPDGVERHLSYGPAGELCLLETVGVAQREEQPLRRKVTFERDKMGRLLARGTDTALTSYSWDAGDRLLQAQRIPSDIGTVLGIGPDTVAFEYDKAGRLVAERGANGTVSYELDELDNLTTLHLPHGQRIDLLSYGSGHVHQIRSGEQLVSDFERDDLHREVMRTQGHLSMRTGYDALGRKLWQSAGMPNQALRPRQGKFWRSYSYHRAGELAELHDSLRGAIRFGYDPAGQLLTQTRVADGSQEQFAWDAAGNLLDDVERKSRGQVQDNRLKVWQDLRFEYDAWGNVVTKLKGANQRQEFRFDAEDRLVSITTSSATGKTETRFEYDALGRRIAKIVTQTDVRDAAPQVEHRRFVWQGLRMVQEVRDSGVSSYVYSPDAPYTPLARLDAVIGEAVAKAAIEKARGKAQVYHFHTDLVGAPLEVTDEAGELAWAGRYKAWGKVEHGEEQVLMPRIDQPLRYPGQYADESTGLHYNTFRYYDPDVGRFISQDPMGLMGGENLYAYASNPTKWLDPWGLCGTTANQAGKALDGGAAKVTVKSREEAQKLFMERYLGQGYRNMTGESGPSTKSLMEWLTGRSTKSGTYHWDDIMDPANPGRVMGHGPDNVDGAMPHLQVHELGGKVIHIFFPWGT